MFKVMAGHRGVGSGVVLFSLARHGLSWRGKVRRGRAQYGEVFHGSVRHGTLLRGLALLGLVRSCPARQRKASSGIIRVLQGLVLCSTVLSGPARLCKAWLFEVWHGMVEWSLVRLGQVVLCSLRQSKAWRYHGLVRSGCAGRGMVEWSFVWHGKPLSWQGGVLSCPVLHGKLLSWPGEVLLGIVGFIGVLYSKVRSYCAAAWQGGAVQSEVRHSTVCHAKLLLRCGIVRHGTVVSGFARLRAVGQALVRRCIFGLGFVWRGPVRQGEAGHAFMRFGSVQRGVGLSGLARYGHVRYEK